MNRTLHSILLTVAITFLVACAASTNQRELSIAAAASMTVPFNEIGKAFTSQTGIPVTFTFASTGHLAQQIRNGAPYDIFAAADAIHVDQLIDDGYLVQNSRMQFALGRLVVIVDPDLRPSIRTPRSIADSDVSRIVLANPDHAPYGLAAKQFLLNSGLWDSVEERLIFAENVRQAAQTVLSGNAVVGIVAKSTSRGVPVEILDIDPGLYDPIFHVAASSTNTNLSEEVSLFMEFLFSPTSHDLFSEYGLIPVGVE